jgi:dipeptidyl aminopeptidase/acylaminoacyl peptidase
MALLLCVCAAHQVAAATRYDPRLRFRTLHTSRFSIHFHQGEEPLARRLAAIAEDVAARVAVELGRPNGLVHVILVDQNDLSNGWANPIPYNVIEITVAAPQGASPIGNTDDWLRLVFSHEYTHIVHLDKARGWIGGLRRVFGRAPILYPNVFLPLWQVEGIATYSESVLTGQGRVPSGDFRFILERAAASKRFEPLDRVNGGLVDWPAGTAHYAYGAYFHQYLAETFGADSIARLAEDTSGRVPYFGSRAFKKVFGRSLGDLWREFEADSARRAQDEPARRTRLTRHGFTVTAPAFSRSGRLFYAVANPHGFPALMELPERRARPRRIADKFLGERISTAGSLLVFDQVEIERNVSLRSDLYAVDADGRDARRLTKGARAADPDVSPDGTTIVCTVQSPDGRALATMPLPRSGTIGSPVVLVAAAGTDFSAPRWSPDGHSVAAERRRLGGPSEIVIIDIATRGVRTLVASRGARNVTPYWMPDGRAILFASDRDRGPFAIYSAAVADGRLRRLEGAGAGVHAPIVSPDGRELVFVGYTATGYDLFSVPLSTATWRDVASSQAVAGASPADLTVDTSEESYRPWRTLLPRFWMPIVESTDGELSAGAATAGADALGRHAYGAAVTWATSRARPDWSFSYAYDRWWPTLFADVSDDTDPWRDGAVRTREVTAGALFAVRRVRYTWSTLAAFAASTDDFDCALCPRPLAGTVTRRALHIGWSFSNAREYGYSISRESGTAVRTILESAPEAFGSDATTGAAAADVRAYVRTGPGHTALALRAAGASSWGDDRRRRVFSASGAGPQSDGFDIGTDAIALLRGFDSASVVGDRALVANVDLRFPIRSIQRGVGTLPMFFRTFHGALFADAGNAWSGTFRRADLRRSFGAELSLDTIVGYALPLTVTSGVAWRDDPVNSRTGWAAFGRVGRAF